MHPDGQQTAQHTNWHKVHQAKKHAQQNSKQIMGNRRAIQILSFQKKTFIMVIHLMILRMPALGSDSIFGPHVHLVLFGGAAGKVSELLPACLCTFPLVR